MIIIRGNVLNDIKNTIAQCSFESGGIMGGSKITEITEYVFDKESSENEYIPDVAKLNNVIVEWANKNIHFLGMIHSHIARKELSAADILYARNIITLNRMKQIIMSVLVLDAMEIYVYMVDRKKVFLVKKYYLCDSSIEKYDNV